MQVGGSIPPAGIPGRKAGSNQSHLVDVAVHTPFQYMAMKNLFHDAPPIAVELNLGLWALAIGAIALELGQQFGNGLIYYAIAPPLIVYGLYKLVLLFSEQEL